MGTDTQRDRQTDNIERQTGIEERETRETDLADLRDGPGKIGIQRRTGREIDLKVNKKQRHLNRQKV